MSSKVYVFIIIVGLFFLVPFQSSVNDLQNEFNITYNEDIGEYNNILPFDNIELSNKIGNRFLSADVSKRFKEVGNLLEGTSKIFYKFIDMSAKLIDWTSKVLKPFFDTLMEIIGVDTSIYHPDPDNPFIKPPWAK